MLKKSIICCCLFQVPTLYSQCLSTVCSKFKLAKCERPMYLIENLKADKSKRIGQILSFRSFYRCQQHGHKLTSEASP